MLSRVGWIVRGHPRRRTRSCLRAPAKCNGPSGSIDMAILLVEDSDAFRSIAHSLLAFFGYQAVAAANATEALQVFQASPETFELLLTDIDMPGMNGLVLAERLLHCNPCLKVLYMSGDFPNPMPPVVPGQIDLIAKPFSIVTLQAKLHDLLAVPPRSKG